MRHFWDAVIITLVGICVMMAVILMMSGCVVVYAPTAERASLYMHDQTATNMTINQDIPVTAKVADELSGIVGAKVQGNTVKGIERQGPAK